MTDDPVILNGDERDGEGTLAAETFHDLSFIAATMFGLKKCSDHDGGDSLLIVERFGSDAH